MRRRGERGAALVEATIVLPILLFLIFAVIEVGGAIKAYSATADAVRSGGRVASVAGADPMADATILGDVARAAGTVGKGEIELVAIWHADGPGDTVPAACLPASIPATPNTSSSGDDGDGADAMGACNVYLRPEADGGAFDMAAGEATEDPEHYFGCSGAADPDEGHKVDCMWPAKDRRVLTSPREAEVVETTDFVGVYVRTRHSYYTGILGASLTITDHSVSLIEPQGYELS